MCSCRFTNIHSENYQKSKHEEKAGVFLKLNKVFCHWIMKHLRGVGCKKIKNEIKLLKKIRLVIVSSFIKVLPILFDLQTLEHKLPSSPPKPLITKEVYNE